MASTTTDFKKEKKRRGKYKKYNLFGSTVDIPKRTQSRWRKKLLTNQISKTTAPKNSSHVPSEFDDVAEKFGNQMEQDVQIYQTSHETSAFNGRDEIQVNLVDLEVDSEKAGDIDVSMDIDPVEDADTASHQQIEMLDPIPPKQKLLNSNEIPKEHLINNLLVMAIKWRRRTTHTVAQDVLKLVNISSDTTNSKSSKYHWKKILDRYSQNVSTYYICEHCNNYLGSENNCPSYCGDCDTKVNRKTNKGSFLHLPLTDQLREIFETTDAHHLYSQSREKHNKYAIEEIYDGKMYKKYISDDSKISINFSVDGAPMFDSSNTSVYPVLCTINELNPHDKRKYILLSSIWFGVGKPKNMNSYLKPFVNEAKKLLEKGFTYVYQGQQYTKTVITLMGVCDSVARPLVRCSTLFNGKFGCGLCLHPGQSVNKGRGHCRVYLMVDENPFGDGLRTHEATLLHAKAQKKEDKKGIKDESILCDIPGYDIIKNLDVDWMHCVGLGVGRQFAGLWFDSTNSEEKFYFGDKIDEFDKYITSFLPTSEISRTPRPLKDRVHMKAHEWIIFILAYSLPAMKMCFPKRYVDHWALLVDGVSILVKPSIMKSELKYAEQCLFDFISGVESLYGKKYVSFNVHLLAHLAISVENWGPLYTHSAFIYEDFNQIIQAYVKSPNGVEIQICDSFRLKCVIDRLLILCSDDLNYKQKEFLNELLNKKLKPNPKFQISNCGVLGQLIIREKLPSDQRLALRRLSIVIDSSTKISSFNRCIINNQVITSQNYKREKKRINYVVLLNNGLIFEIKNFIALEKNSCKCTYMMGYYYVLTNKPFTKNRKLEHLLTIDEKMTAIAAVNTDLINKKVIILGMPKLNAYVAYAHSCDLELLT